MNMYTTRDHATTLRFPNTNIAEHAPHQINFTPMPNTNFNKPKQQQINHTLPCQLSCSPCVSPGSVWPVPPLPSVSRQRTSCSSGHRSPRGTQEPSSCRRPQLPRGKPSQSSRGRSSVCLPCHCSSLLATKTKYLFANEMCLRQICIHKITMCKEQIFINH